MDRTIESIGLQDQDIPRYVTQYFKKLKKPELGKKVSTQIKTNPNLHGMAHVPINAYLLCHLYQKESNPEQDNTALKDFTLTQLYQRLVVDLCKRMAYYQPQHHQSDGNNHPNRLLRLRDRALIHRYQKPLWILAHLAFSGLTQTQSLTLPWTLQDNVLEALDYEIDDYVNHVLPLGLLKTIRENSEDTTEASRYFMHLTFQEFFAALYLVWSLAQYEQATPQDKDSALIFIKNNKYTPRYQVIFWFTAGLVRNATWFNNDNTIQQTALTTLWHQGFLSKPQDITGFGQFHLLAHAFEEGGTPDASSFSSQDNLINSAWLFIKNTIDKTLDNIISDEKSKHLWEPLFTTLTACPRLSNEYTQPLVESLQGNDRFITQRAIYALSKLNLSNPEISQKIAECLLHNDLYIHQSAIRALVQLNVTDANIFQQIAVYLTDNNALVRRSSIQALTQLKVSNSELHQKIAEHLIDDNESVRQSAIEALAQLKVSNSELHQKIAERLIDDNENIRLSAIRALVQLNVTDPRILTQIAGRLTDNSENIRLSAIDALAQLDVSDPKLLKLIVERLTDYNIRVCRNAGRTLAQLNVSDLNILQLVANYLQHRNPNIRLNAIDALAQLNVSDPEILKQITERLTDDNEHIRQCTARIILHRLKVTNPNIHQQIATYLQHDNKGVRKSALDALTRNVTDPKLLQKIAEHLTDDNEGIRRSAIKALAQIDITDLNTLQLITNYLEHKNKNVRLSAVDTLGQLNITDPKLIQLIAKRLTDDNEDVRLSALNALARLKVNDIQIHHQITERLADNTEKVRERTLYTLGQLNITDPKLLQQIVHLLTHNNMWIRLTTLNTLGQLNITDRNLLQQIAKHLTDNSKDIRQSTIYALAQLKVSDPQIHYQIAELLTDDNKGVRNAAIKALVQLGVSDPLLHQKIAEHLLNDKWHVHNHTLEILAQLNVTDSKTLHLIAKCLTDGNSRIRLSAIDALTRLNVTDPKTLQLIAERLTDNNEDVRQSAAKTLYLLQYHLTIECWLPIWDKYLANDIKRILSATTVQSLMMRWIKQHLKDKTNSYLASDLSQLKISRLFAHWIFDWLQLPLIIDENKHTLHIVTAESADKLSIEFPHHPLGQTAFKRCKQALELEKHIHPFAPFLGCTHLHTPQLNLEIRFNALQQHLEHYLDTSEDFDFSYVLQNLMFTYASLFEQKPRLWQPILDLFLKHPANHLTQNLILHHFYKTTPIQTLLEKRNWSVDDSIFIGGEHYNEAQLDEAIHCYEQAVSTDPNHAEPYHNLACYYHVKAHITPNETPQYLELAEYAFKQALKLNPTPQLHTEYGLFLYIQKHYKEALPFLNQAIEAGYDVVNTNLCYDLLDLPTLDITLQIWVQNYETLSINSAQLAHYLKYRCYEALGKIQQQITWLSQWAEWLVSVSNKDKNSDSGSDSGSDSDAEDGYSVSQYLLTTCQNEQAARATHIRTQGDTPEATESSSAKTVAHEHWQPTLATSPLGHPVESFNHPSLLSTPSPLLTLTASSHEATADNEENTIQNADTTNTTP